MIRLKLMPGLAMACLSTLAAVPVWAEQSASEAMDQIVTRLYQTMTLEELYGITVEGARELLTPEEREVLATRHWFFDVNVPVVVSVMRSTGQEKVPYWLPERGFTRTDLIVKNKEDWTYEVWQKSFPRGTVGLGINGFDNHLPHYFVAVRPENPNDKLTMSNFHPVDQTVLPMEVGSMTYHDWTELVLTDVPQALRGQRLLTTIRGRAREASLADGFRKTPFPSTIAPSPVYLTWSEDPRTTQNVQWRSSSDVTVGVVRYREVCSGKPFREISAAYTLMNDRMLANDPKCHWFNAEITGLTPDTAYEYQAGHPEQDSWSRLSTFTTAPDGAQAFRVLHISDTQDPEDTRVAFRQMTSTGFDADFLVNSGDLVRTGIDRQDWDMLLKYGQPWLSRMPMMPCIGNHDARLGLGAHMYLTIFDLPDNGAEGIPQDASYTFAYSNTDFFVLDVMSDRAPQTKWLRKVLASSDATWKIAMLHVPLFLHEGHYSEWEQQWGSAFQEYGVDLVLTGHVHFYARSHPIRDGRPEPGGDGPIYITSVTIPGGEPDIEQPDTIKTMLGGGSMVNVIDIDGDRLHWQARTTKGELKDEFTLKK